MKKYAHEIESLNKTNINVEWIIIIIMPVINKLKLWPT